MWTNWAAVADIAWAKQFGIDKGDTGRFTVHPSIVTAVAHSNELVPLNSSSMSLVTSKADASKSSHQHWQLLHHHVRSDEGDRNHRLIQVEKRLAQRRAGHASCVHWYGYGWPSIHSITAYSVQRDRFSQLRWLESTNPFVQWTEGQNINQHCPETKDWTKGGREWASETVRINSGQQKPAPGEWN